MNAKGSRRKGQSFERQIASLLSKRFGVTLRRTPLSGGWSDSAQVAGDIVCTHPGPDAFPFCVECKNSEYWKLENLFVDKRMWFNAWWNQLLNECPADKKPLLIFKRRRIPPLASYRVLDFELCDMEPCRIPMLYVTIHAGIVTAITSLEDFLSYVCPIGEPDG